MDARLFAKNAKKQTPERTAWKAALAVFGMVLFVDVVLSYISYINVRHETRHYIARMANTAMVMTDVTLHQTLTHPDQKGTLDYLKVQAPYRALLKANPDLFYVYSMLWKNEKVYFVIDTQREQETFSEKDVGERKSTANIMEEYDDATPTLKQAMLDQKLAVENEPYSDKWGTFISAYAPLKNSKGEFIGMVGADMLATPFFNRLRNVLLGFVGGIAIAALLAFLTYKSVLKFGLREAGHTRAALRRLAYMESFQQEMRQVVDSIADMGYRIADGVEQIALVSSQNVLQVGNASKSIQGSADCIQSIALVSNTLLETLADMEHSLRSSDISIKTMLETLQGSTDGDTGRRMGEALRRIHDSNIAAIASCQSQRELVGQITEDSKAVAASAQNVEKSIQEISEATSEMDEFLSDIVKTMRALSDQNNHLKQQVSAFLTILRQTGPGPDNVQLSS